MKIAKINAQEIYDSRGIPTIGVRVELENGMAAYTAYPSGSSDGSHEALDLRDGGKRLKGKGVTKAVKNVEGEIASAIVGMSVYDQAEIDAKMIDLDGTENKSRLGGNAILGVSMAIAKAAAMSKEIPLYQYLRQYFLKWNPVLPIPLMVLIEGGEHAEDSTDLQEYMVMPLIGDTFSKKMEVCVEINNVLEKIVSKKGWSTAVGQEGAFAGPVKNNEEPLKLLVQAIEESGYKPGEDVFIALDAAASEFYKDGKYHLKRDGKVLTTDEMVEMYVSWVKKYPILSLEDGFHEDDWDGFIKLTKQIGEEVQIVGDDLYTTNPKRFQLGVGKKASNAILVKLNQIGTVSETIEVLKMSQENDWQAIVSQRAGETEDTFYADLCVASGCGQIKSGAPKRGERVAKYNRLLWIEKEMALKVGKNKNKK